MPPHTSSLSQDHNVNYSAMQVKLQYSPGDVVPKQCEQHLMLLCCVKALKQLWVGDESVNSKVQRRSCSVSNFNSHTKQQCNRNVSAYFTVFTSVETKLSPYSKRKQTHVTRFCFLSNTQGAVFAISTLPRQSKSGHINILMRRLATSVSNFLYHASNKRWGQTRKPSGCWRKHRATSAVLVILVVFFTNTLSSSGSGGEPGGCRPSSFTIF